MEEKEFTLDDLYSDVEVIDNREEEQPQEEVVENQPKEEEEKELELDDLYQEEEEKVKPSKKEEQPVTQLDGAIAGIKLISELFGVSEETIQSLDQIDNEEDLIEFIDQLGESYKSNIYDNLKHEDPITEAIFEMKEAGGNPELIIDSFKKQKELNTFNLDSEKDQIELIKMDLEEKGFSKEKIQARIDRFVALGEDALKEEAALVKERKEKEFEQEREYLIEEQKRLQSLEKARLQKRQELLIESFKKEKVNKSEADTLLDIAFSKRKIKETQEVMDYWQIKAMQLLNNPETQLDFVRFLADKNKYDESVVKRSSEAKTVKTFKKTLELPKKTTMIEDKPVSKQPFKIKFD